ncbi:ASCH domain-containing protein [Microbacterium sp. AK031]|uniref:ASCH domain-containing protein n=1 Tax=Microbacterium sp. AK031 TaxID=2723076 RepID=UPI002167BA8C|nr:ASCH domain-containing protein [Microbacterium sp. AK031]MCS3844497.1 histidinol-phosphate aminotransferase [Microbacterium sp. AK031]
MTDPLAIEEFWRECRTALPGLPAAVPEAWAFGATPAHADSLLALVLDGTKTATASSLWDYEHSQEPVPEAGLLNIILDGFGVPCALLETVSVEVVPFNEVDASHAFAEGEGDRSLSDWRGTHERYWREYSENPRGFEPDMPVVCERFRLMYATTGSR